MNTVAKPSTSKTWFWIAVTFTVAMCSVLYELVLAQTMSSVMGNTSYRYNLTIGLYIASMGLGAILVDRVSKVEQLSYFLRVEILISIIGAIAPWAVIIHDSGMQSLSANGIVDYFSTGVQFWLSSFNNGLIILIGFLSGVELPLLMRIGKTVNLESSTKVLSVDYLGTTVGAILFPLVLFPNLNLFTMGYLFSLINILTALAVAYSFKTSNLYKIFSFVWLVVILLMLTFSNEINPIMVNWFYFKG